MRLYQSFDEEVMREMYDGDFGVCSDFNSECSWISYPPANEGLWDNDPFYQAKVGHFREKIKSKFNYKNIITESRPAKQLPKALKLPSRMT